MKGNIQKLDSLTGLRFLAALWVMLFHYREYGDGMVWSYPYADSFIIHGGAGVDLFFVLSGFILSHVYNRTFVNFPTSWRDYKIFVVFRLARIYPVHLATLTLMLLMALGQFLLLGLAPPNPQRYSVEAIVASLTLTHAWLPGEMTPNMPAWSISAEFGAYLVFPFLMALIQLRQRAPAMFMVTGVLFYVLYQVFGSTPVMSVFLRIGGGVLLGMVAFQWKPGFRKVLRTTGASRFAGMTMMAALVLMLVGLPVWAPVLALLCALLVMSLADETDLAGKLLARSGFVYLGEISYSLYMIHWPARVVVREALERSGMVTRLHPAMIVACYSVVALAGAVILYHLVEQPGRSAIRRWSRRAISGKQAEIIV